MRFWSDLYYALVSGALIGAAIGLYRRRARERREAEGRWMPPPRRAELAVLPGGGELRRGRGPER